MPEERSSIALRAHNDEASKLDHAFLAVIGAAILYSTNQIPEQPLVKALNSANLILFATALLVGALLAGFKRVEAIVRLHANSSQMFGAAEKRRDLAGTAAMGRFIDQDTGGSISPSSYPAARAQYDANVKSASDAMRRAQTAAVFWYGVRNNAFMCAVVLLVAAKVLSGYEGDNPSHESSLPPVVERQGTTEDS